MSQEDEIINNSYRSAISKDGSTIAVGVYRPKHSGKVDVYKKNEGGFFIYKTSIFPNDNVFDERLLRNDPASFNDRYSQEIINNEFFCQELIINENGSFIGVRSNWAHNFYQEVGGSYNLIYSTESEGYGPVHQDLNQHVHQQTYQTMDVSNDGRRFIFLTFPLMNNSDNHESTSYKFEMHPFMLHIKNVSDNLEVSDDVPPSMVKYGAQTSTNDYNYNNQANYRSPPVLLTASNSFIMLHISGNGEQIFFSFNGMWPSSTSRFSMMNYHWIRAGDWIEKYGIDINDYSRFGMAGVSSKPDQHSITEEPIRGTGTPVWCQVSHGYTGSSYENKKNFNIVGITNGASASNASTSWDLEDYRYNTSSSYPTEMHILGISDDGQTFIVANEQGKLAVQSWVLAPGIYTYGSSQYVGIGCCYSRLLTLNLSDPKNITGTTSGISESGLFLSEYTATSKQACSPTFHSAKLNSTNTELTIYSVDYSQGASSANSYGIYPIKKYQYDISPIENEFE